MRAKKHLGQNFLKSKQAISCMLRTANISTGDVVVEVGPGKGVLTIALLEEGAHVIAIEKDADLIAVLKDSFKEYIDTEQLEIIEGDVLETDIPTPAGDVPYKLVANIPYYITGQILRYFLGAKKQPETMTLLVQKEVAERVIARDGKESILSMSVKAYGDPLYIEKVPARYFSPAPKVDSAILHITDVSRDLFEECTEEEFFKVVHAGFAHKRKQLGGNLRDEWDRDVVEAALHTCEIGAEVRAETLQTEDWVCLAETLKKPL